jgi:hypothetical protein
VERTGAVQPGHNSGSAGGWLRSLTLTLWRFYALTRLKPIIQHIVQTRFGNDRTFTAATLDVPWMNLITHPRT